MDDRHDEARKRILERRARFVAAAIATFGASCSRPQPCLSAVPLEVKDAPPADASSATAQPESSETAPPMPCLSPPPAHTPPPAVCLSPVVPPKDDAGT